jgi:hypothetical protein
VTNVEQLDHDQPEPKVEEDEREVGGEQRVEDRGADSHPEGLDPRPGHVERHRPAVRHLHHPALERAKEGALAGLDEVDHAHRQRLVRGDADRVHDGVLRPGLVPSVAVGEVLDVSGRIVGDLLLLDRAGDPDRVRRTDVRPRGHGGHRATHHDERPRRRGAGALGRHVADHGDPRAEDGLDDLAHRGIESTRRVDREEHGRVALGVRRLDPRSDVVGRERIHHAAEPELQDGWRLGLRSGARRRQGEDHQGHRRRSRRPEDVAHDGIIAPFVAGAQRRIARGPEPGEVRTVGAVTHVAGRMA